MRTITEIDADLAVFYDARQKATIAKYSTDSGQSRTSVERDLAQINATIKLLEEERRDVSGDDGGVFSITVDRGAL